MFVRILNSPTASVLVVAMLPPLSPVSMLVTPSIVMLFEFGRWPFTVKELTEALSLPAFASSESAPGTSSAKLNIMRPLAAMFYAVKVADVIDPREYANDPNAVKAITARYTAGLERLIREHPEQYFWLHRRWKHQPAAKKAKKAA